MISGLKGLWSWFKYVERENRDAFEKMKATLIAGVFAVVSASAAAVEYSPVIAQTVLDLAGVLIGSAIAVVCYRFWEYVEYEIETP